MGNPKTIVNDETYDLWGTTDSDVASLTINGKLVSVDGSGNFDNSITLSPGSNTLVIESKDRAGNSIQEIITVSYMSADTGTNWSAIGVMIMLLVVGLVLGLMFGKMMGGGVPPEEEPVDDIPPEELDADEVPEDLDEELPEDGLEDIPEEEMPEGAEPIPVEEGMPEEMPEEEIPEDLPDEEDMPEELDADEVPEDLDEEPVDISEEITSDEAEPLESEEVDAVEPEDAVTEEAPEEAPEDADTPEVEEDPRILKLKEAYESGKISQELYEKNLARFKEQ